MYAVEGYKLTSFTTSHKGCDQIFSLAQASLLGKENGPQNVILCTFATRDLLLMRRNNHNQHEIIYVE